MWLLDPLSSMADVLDTLSDDEWWSVNALMEDTGRTRRTILGVCDTLVMNDLTIRRPMPGAKRKQVQFQISDKGRLWLWACENELPPRHLDYVFTLIARVQRDGPVLTTVLYQDQELQEHKTRRGLKLLHRLGYLWLTQLEGYGRYNVQVTDQGAELLRTWKKLGCEEAA